MSSDDVDAVSSFEAIPRDECLRLLATQQIGRIAVADFNAAPLIVPVNFLVDGEAVLFRTDYGSKFRLAVLAGHPVSFEVDVVHLESHLGRGPDVERRTRLGAEDDLGVEHGVVDRQDHRLVTDHEPQSTEVPCGQQPKALIPRDAIQD